MVDAGKVLFREGAREEYWYFRGFLEGYKSAKAKYGSRTHPGWGDSMEHGMEQTVRNAKEQITDEPERY